MKFDDTPLKCQVQGQFSKLFHLLFEKTVFSFWVQHYVHVLAGLFNLTLSCWLWGQTGLQMQATLDNTARLHVKKLKARGVAQWPRI